MLPPPSSLLADESIRVALMGCRRMEPTIPGSQLWNPHAEVTRHVGYEHAAGSDPAASACVL